MAIELYDLAGAEEDRRFSPFCWRSKLALAHKGLAYRTIPWRFTEKDAIAFSGQGRVPVLVDDGRTVFDSWTIASYLEDTYPDRPSLFGGPGGRAMARFVANWSDTVVHAGIARLIIADVHDHLYAKDQAYFRKSREERFGASLASVQADRDRRVVDFRQSLAPLRLTLQAQPFLGGTAPNYADYVAFGGFQWARCISPFQVLAADDPVAAWRGRLLAAFDGLAGKAKGYAV